MSIIIRKLQPPESAIYREVRLSCLKNVPGYFGSTYEEEVLNPKFIFETFIENGSPDHVMFGAFDEEQLIGITGFYAFTLDGIEQVQLSVIADNRAAIQLYEKVGFKTFGVQPRYFKAGDTYMDQQFMQLFKSDYS